MDAPVAYIPDLVWKADEAFERLMAELPWERYGLPRDEVYFNDTMAPYTYGSPGRERTYEPEALWHPTVLDIRAMVEDAIIGAGCGGVMDVCFCNRYMGARDQLGWHADDSPEMDPSRPIVTVSLGAERDIQFIQFRTTADHRDAIMRVGSPHIETLTLGHGSAAIMKPGMQQGWFHRIPKSSVSNIGPRISLTFRGYLSEVDQIDRHHASSLADEVEVERLGADYFDS